MRDTTSREPYHAKPGDSLADPYNIPGIVLFLAGMVGLAATLTAAGEGITGWVVAGAAATATCFVSSVTVFWVEHERLRRLAHGRSAIRTSTQQKPQTPA